MGPDAVGDSAPWGSRIDGLKPATRHGKDFKDSTGVKGQVEAIAMVPWIADLAVAE